MTTKGTTAATTPGRTAGRTLDWPRRLERLPGVYAVCRLEPGAPLPRWAESLLRAVALPALGDPPAAAPTPRTSQPAGMEGPTDSPIPATNRPNGPPTRPVGLISIARTPGEISIVAPEDLVPEDLASHGVRSGLPGAIVRSAATPRPRIQRGHAALRVAGTLDFALVGVLADLSSVLASAGVPILALSTFDTDILLVPLHRMQEAEGALRSSGWTVT